MSIWSFCDDLDMPEVGYCLSDDFWTNNLFEIHDWFKEQGFGRWIADRVVLVPKDKRAFFLLRWEPQAGDLDRY